MYIARVCDLPEDSRSEFVPAEIVSLRSVLGVLVVLRHSKCFITFGPFRRFGNRKLFSAGYVVCGK